MLGDTVASLPNDDPAATSVITEIGRAAIRRGVLAMPFGIAAGWVLGRYQSTSDVEQGATVLALYLGFTLVPALAASIHAGRVASGRLRKTVLGSMAAALAAGLAWGAFGGVAMYGFGLATTLRIDAMGVGALCVLTGLVAGALGALLGVGLGRRRVG